MNRNSICRRIALGALGWVVLAMAGRAQNVSPLQIQEAVVYLGEGSPYESLRVTVVNPTSQRMSYRLNIIGGFGSGSQHSINGEQIEPGAARHYGIALLSESKSYGVHLEDEVGRSTLTNARQREVRALHIAPTAGWASTTEIENYQQRNGMSAPTPRYGGTSPELMIEQIIPENLPDHWLFYAPFKRIFMSGTTWKQLSQAESDALSRWTEAGGQLVVYDAPANRIEPMLTGRLYHQIDNPFKGPIKDGLGPGRFNGWSARYGADDPDNNEQFPYSVHKSGGRAGGLALATLFFVVAGPINHFYFSRKRRRPRALLITLPVLSIGCCLAMTVSFVVLQGFSCKGGSYSLTVLDEATNRAFVYTRHSVLSGLYPIGGFQFGPRTGFYPMRAIDPDQPYTMDLTGGMTLRSGLFQPSVEFRYMTFMPFQTRERLIVDAVANTVTNGFETPIKKLVLVTFDNRVLQAGPIAPGRKADLEPVVAEKRPRIAPEDRCRELWKFFPEQTGETYIMNLQCLAPESPYYSRNQYMILFDGPRDSVEPGVSIKDNGQTNILYGMMEAPNT